LYSWLHARKLDGASMIGDMKLGVKYPRMPASTFIRLSFASLLFCVVAPNFAVQRKDNFTRYLFTGLSLQDKLAADPVLAMYSTRGFIDSTKNSLGSLSKIDYCKFDKIHLWALDSETQDAFKGNAKVLLRPPLLPNLPNTSSDYGTHDFKLLMLHKTFMLHQLVEEVAESGRSILYMDSDMVTRKPVLDFLLNYEKESDILFQYNGKNANAGFMFIRPTRAAKDFIANWKNVFHQRATFSPERPGDDQAVLNEILGGSLNWQATRISYLPWDLFPNGAKYFDEQFEKKDVKVIHNNCIVGLSKKTQRLKENDLWNPNFEGHLCLS
jgi:hypothetical protein